MTITHEMFKDGSRSIDDKVAQLIQEMTIDEKIAQLAGLWASSLMDDQRQFSSSKAEAELVNGIGHITRVSAASFLPPPASAKLTNRIQKHLVENTRLGIPAIVHEESCAGFMARGATSFPQSIGLAATFEPDLIEQMAIAIRLQMRAVGAHHTLAPVFDVVRDPRWGRVEETYGEDPFLISNIGLAYVKGVQGSDLSTGVVATGKHFAAHGIPAGGRNWGPVQVNARELREIFLTPFWAAIKEGNIASMMNAYHEWDGVPVGASKELMVDILRDEMGFDGVVVSDYFTLRTLVDYHYVAADRTESALMGLEAGIDIELPFAECYGEPLKQGIESGQIPLDLVETSVSRVLRMKFQLDLFNNPYVDEGTVLEVYNTPDQVTLAQTLAQKSMVLLKNEGILPLKKSIASIAVIGPIADSIRCLQGDYHYPAHLTHVFEQMLSENQPMPQDSEAKPFTWDDHFPAMTSVLDAIKSTVSPDTVIHYAPGCDAILTEDTSGFEEAINAARQSDVAILVVGDQSGLGVGCSVGEALDSATLQLPGVQQALVEAIHATGIPVVLVCVTGRPYALSWVDKNVPAIIEAWLPSQGGGQAIADVLFGDVNPGGKLPMSFPRSVGQLPVFYNHKPSGQKSNWHTNYMDMDVTPLYHFGHGLSYTSFAYSDLNISKNEVTNGDVVTVSCVLENTGDVAGDEVVQLYVADPIATVTRPVKALKGFKRVHLQSGEKKRITFKLDVRHLAFYDTRMRYIIEKGQINVMIGSSSSDIRLQHELTITETSECADHVFLTPVTVEAI